MRTSRPIGVGHAKRTSGAAAILCVLLFSPLQPQPFASAQGSANGPQSAEVRIGVLGLFHAKQFRVTATAEQALLVRAGADQIILESSSGLSSVNADISSVGVAMAAGPHNFHGRSVSISARSGAAADFVLAIPGKVSRRYSGKLEIMPSEGGLSGIITMDREAAVASVVAAESLPGTPIEALKAQAVAARSYLASGRGRHRDFDFCDTTHCQFLREPPAPNSAVASAVKATRGLVLAYNDQPFAPMYTRSCSGQTHTPAELGLPSGAYPYYSAECAYCRAHPARWTSRVSTNDAAMLRSSDEGSRLEIDRRLGWAAVQSPDFVATRQGARVLLNGTGNGHGIGLCQSGSKAMAEQGASFREILSHYYPNTVIVTWQNGDGIRQIHAEQSATLE